jgi:hypothetical protein
MPGDRALFRNEQLFIPAIATFSRSMPGCRHVHLFAGDS